NLQLPSETMDYVPRLLALAQIVSTPEQFGIRLPDLNDEPYFAQITIRRPLDLLKAAELASISADEMRYLNPAFKHRVATPRQPNSSAPPWPVGPTATPRPSAAPRYDALTTCRPLPVSTAPAWTHCVRPTPCRAT